MNELNINLLVAIVVRAMKEGFIIDICYNRITITNTEDKYISITLFDERGECIEKSHITIESDRGRDTIENISDEDVLRFKLLIKDCEKYEKNKLIEDLNNFFTPETESQAKEVSINDLDNDEE